MLLPAAVAALSMLLGVHAAPHKHTLLMNVSNVYESPLPAFFFLEGSSEGYGHKHTHTQ